MSRSSCRRLLSQSLDLPSADVLAIRLTYLAPVQRAALDAVIAVGRPVRTCEVDLGSNRWQPAATQRTLVWLWTNDLIERVLLARRDPWYGSAPRYVPAPGVAEAAARYPSTTCRGGMRVDPDVGCAVLAAARGMVSQGIKPDCRAIGREIGACYETCQRWGRRLRAIGLWPEDSGLRMRDRVCPQVRPQVVRCERDRRGRFLAVGVSTMEVR